jgi:hypothetical protein
MKIILPVGGEDVADHFHNIYQRIMKTNESVITSFNGITAILFPDEAGFEHARYSNRPFRKSVNLDAIKSYYMRELEAKEPSGYTEVRKYYDQRDEESRLAREKVKKVEEIIKSLELIEQNSNMTRPSLSAIKSQLKIAIS